MLHLSIRGLTACVPLSLPVRSYAFIQIRLRQNTLSFSVSSVGVLRPLTDFF